MIRVNLQQQRVRWVRYKPTPAGGKQCVIGYTANENYWDIDFDSVVEVTSDGRREIPVISEET